MSTSEQTPAVPRVRRNYTQGANGTWRAEFTVESYHNPLESNQVRDIRDEDQFVAGAVRATLATLNGKGADDANR